VAVVRDGNTITMYMDGDAKRVNYAGRQVTVPDYEADPSLLQEYALTARDMTDIPGVEALWSCFRGEISHVLVDNRPYSAEEIADEHACAAGDLARCLPVPTVDPTACGMPAPAEQAATPTYVEASMNHTSSGYSTAFCYGYGAFALNAAERGGEPITKPGFETGECPTTAGTDACSAHYQITRSMTLAMCEALCNQYDLCAEIMVKNSMTEDPTEEGDCIMLRTGCDGNSYRGRAHPYIYPEGSRPYDGNFKYWDIYRKE